MSDMNWNLFWSAFGAIGGVLGAVATFLAVVIALWQTKYEHKKKLKIMFSDNINVISETGNINKKYVGVSISNIGNRQVVIKNWGILVNKKSKYIIIPDISSIGKVIEVQLPYKLDVEEHTDLFYQYELFVKVTNKIINEKQQKSNKKIRFFIEDSTGKRYIVKSGKKAKEYMK